MNETHLTGCRLWYSVVLILIICAFVGVSTETIHGADDKPTEEIVDVYMGQSRVVQTPWPVSRVAVTDPKIAKVQVLTPTQVLVQGVAMGTTDLMLWKDDETFQKMYVKVGADLTVLRAQLHALAPGGTLKLS